MGLANKEYFQALYQEKKPFMGFLHGIFLSISYPF
jgi:hypothetical protein